MTRSYSYAHDNDNKTARFISFQMFNYSKAFSVQNIQHDSKFFILWIFELWVFEKYESKFFEHSFTTIFICLSIIYAPIISFSIDKYIWRMNSLVTIFHFSRGQTIMRKMYKPPWWYFFSFLIIRFMISYKHFLEAFYWNA